MVFMAGSALTSTFIVSNDVHRVLKKVSLDRTACKIILHLMLALKIKFLIAESHFTLSTKKVESQFISYISFVII